jgi:hypothetical protein
VCLERRRRCEERPLLMSRARRGIAWLAQWIDRLFERLNQKPRPGYQLREFPLPPRII